MDYAIDLSPRQTTRTLEQAVRHRADLLAIPRVRLDEQPILCRLESVGTPEAGKSSRACMVVIPVVEAEPAGQDVASESPPKGSAAAGSAPYEGLVGTYCDVTLQLGDNRYVFCSDVVAVGEFPQASGVAAIFLARPQTIQVTQRRRFWRFLPEQSSQVELNWTDADLTPRRGGGWLCNLSGDGLACRVDTGLADRLAIGGKLRAEFSLTPGNPERFALEAVLCSKTPAGTQGTMILGLQFSTGAGNDASAAAAEALRRQLLARYARTIDVPKGADA